MKHPITQTTLATTTIALLTGHAAASDPVFFSWQRQHASGSTPVTLYPESGTTNHYTYCPQPGGNHGQGNYKAYDSVIESIWDEMEGEDLPVAIMMRDRNSPWGSAPTWNCFTGCGGSIPDYPVNNNHSAPRHPETLASAYAIRDEISDQVNYIICDLEPYKGNTMDDVSNWMINIADIAFGNSSLGVTGFPDGLSNPAHNVSQATIQSWDAIVGNYATHLYPDFSYDNGSEIITAPSDITNPWPGDGQSEKIRDQNYLFTSLGLNLISPVTYARATHVRHTMSHWTGEDSPTTRAAYMYGGIETFSSALREEITHGDLTTKTVLPWVSPFIVTNDTDPTAGLYEGCWMPPNEDFLATIKHLRLRGSDGFIFWAGANTYTPGGSFETKYWSQTDPITDEHLNPWYDASDEWADSGSTLNGFAWFEKHALVSWEELDGEYGSNAVVYRLDTYKESGLIVSAMNDRGRLSILASYMKPTPGGSSILVDMDEYFQEARDYSSGTTEYLSCGEYSHTYSQNFFTPDIDGDYDFDNDDVNLWNALYNASDPRADWNQDSIINYFDATLFTTAGYAYSN